MVTLSYLRGNNARKYYSIRYAYSRPYLHDQSNLNFIRILIISRYFFDDFNDWDLYRTTGRNVEIKDYDFSDLPKLQTHVAIDFLYQQSFSSEDRSEEHISIPTLEEVFRNFPDLCINIDIKTYNETLIEEVNKLGTIHKLNKNWKHLYRPGII